MKTEILGNDIIWSADSKSCKELDEASIWHIEDMIRQGYTSGSLEVSMKRKTTSGWWEIVNWKDIACELYNATQADIVRLKPQMMKAIKRFNDNWN